jgi:predicted ABC-type ATPase
VTSDFLRHLLLEAGISFSFETVMSSRDKVEFMRAAQAVGYRTYLYYIATEDPEINVNRVENRVKLGGHPVEAEKIRSRYTRSLDLLFDALSVSHRAYIFDNSKAPGGDFLVAELEGGTLSIRAESVPAWFKEAVLHKIE